MKPPPTNDPRTVEASPNRSSVSQTFSSLRHRDLRFLLGGTFFMSAGNWIQQVTLGWLAYDMTQSAFMVGAVTGARSIPFLLTGPIGGVLGDRMDRKKILMATQLAQITLALIMGTLLATDNVQVWHLFAFTILTGAAWAFMNPVRMALVANLVPKEDLMNAVALNSAAFNLNRAIGPAVGGLLIFYFGPATNFFLQALMYGGVLAAIFPLKVPAHERGIVAGVSVFSNLAEGFRYIGRKRTILVLLLISLVPSLFMMPFTHGILPVFAEEVLHAGPEGLGYLFSAAGFGGLVATFLVASLGNFRKKGLLMLGGIITAGFAMILLSRMTLMPLAMVSLALVAGNDMVFRAVNNTLLQTRTDDQYRSRVMSVVMMDHGLVPLGSLLAGTLAQFYGAPLAILVGGTTVVVLVGLLAARFSSLRTG